eukprot:6459555-Amphidinium_carterae.2
MLKFNTDVYLLTIEGGVTIVAPMLCQEPCRQLLHRRWPRTLIQYYARSALESFHCGSVRGAPLCA